MVNHEIPQHYTHSPSSFGGTPQLTINRDITALDLDSSNAFEGPEKLLEIWFCQSETALPPTASPQGLKSVDEDAWKDMLDLVNCKVLSRISSRNVDAYLLSESSMFVFPHKLVLKTCGTTTLLYGVPRMLEIAALNAGFPHTKANPPQGIPAAATPYRVFYSRKNFLHPDQQRGPHRSWRDEVAYLDKLCLSGSAYMIGKMNGEHWYLYISGPQAQLTPPATPDDQRIEPALPAADRRHDIALLGDACFEDETLEMLMTDLDVENAHQFYEDEAQMLAKDSGRRAHEARLDAIDHLGVIDEDKASDARQTDNNPGNELHYENASFDVFRQTSSEHEKLDCGESPEGSREPVREGHALGKVVTESCGLSELYPTSKYPDARIDSFVFDPCGYSANGVVPSPSDPASTHYWTVHVTPEPQCSYASFETNVPTSRSGHGRIGLIQQVVGVFKPGRFSVTLFEAKSGYEKAGGRNEKLVDFVKGYRTVDRILHDLDGYELVFRYFERDGFTGGVPRLGENCA